MPSLTGTWGQQDCGPAVEQKVSWAGCRGPGSREGRLYLATQQDRAGDWETHPGTAPPPPATRPA